MKVQTKKSAQCEVIVLDLDIGLVDAAVRGLKDRHGVLSNCIRGVCRYAQNGDAALRCRLGIHVVEACAAKKDQFDAALAEDLNNFAGRFVIDEDADRVIALGQVCGLDGQTAVEILDVYVVCAFTLVSGQFAEKHTVIVLGAKERNLKDFFLFCLGSDIRENFFDLGDRLFLIRTVSSDVESGSLCGMKAEDLKNVIAGSNISVALDHYSALEIGAGLREKCCGARVDPQRILYCVLKIFHLLFPSLYNLMDSVIHNMLSSLYTNYTNYSIIRHSMWSNLDKIDNQKGDFMLKGAIFDMDGLMFDTERIYRDTWVRLAGMYGVLHNPEFPKAVCGTSGDHMVEVIHTYYPTVDAAAFRDDCLRIVDETIQKEVPIKKGLFEILDGMKEHGVKMAVASSSQPGLIRRNLRNAGVEEYFDAVVSGVEVENGKPAPDIFLYAAEKIGIDPADCYVFEDGLNGIKAGAAAGCRVIMIPDLTEPTDEIRALCSGIYEDLGAAMRALR